MWCVWGGYTHLTPLHALSLNIMIKVQPMNGTNPGFAAIKETAIADVKYAKATIKVKNEEHAVTRVDFVNKDNSVFAALNSYGSSLAYIVLVDEGNRELGSFFSEPTSLDFPKKGILYSKPIKGATGETKDGRTWQRHQVYLKGVKWQDFKQA